VNQLIVVVFDSEDAARETLARIRQIEGEGQIQLEDTAVVVRDHDGKTHVKNEVSATTETATVVGAVLGALLWFLFPVVGIVIGAAAGALVGRLFDTGVDDKFSREVRDKLAPGKSALFLVVRGGSMDAIRGALEPYHGEVLQTTLDSDAEAELREALR
jgi:uncharacterized membrane protein